MQLAWALHFGDLTNYGSEKGRTRNWNVFFTLRYFTLLYCFTNKEIIGVVCKDYIANYKDYMDFLKDYSINFQDYRSFFPGL